jgi:dephospho-CoA kinase
MTVLFDCLAITGGIGSGKSSVLNILKNEGYTIINTDTLAHSLLHFSSEYYQQYSKEIDNLIGTDYQNHVEINRDELRQKLMNLPDGYQKITKIAQPYIKQIMIQEYNNVSYKNNKIIFEVPLLLETNFHHYFSHVLVITCNLAIRKNRILLRNPHLTHEDIDFLINIQSTDADKISIADFTLDNSDDLHSLIHKTKQFSQLYNTLLSN